MPVIRLQEVHRKLLGAPYTTCVTQTANIRSGHDVYNPLKCHYAKLYAKIFNECNCILRYVDDIDEYFDEITDKKVVKRSSIALMLL